MHLEAPSAEALRQLIGQARLTAWQSLCREIDARCDMEREWSSGGKKWQYEYRYRRGGKTLCALYARENAAGLMVIFGAKERERFEQERASLSAAVCQCYDEATTYHDGKWVMFPIEDADGAALLNDLPKLPAMKRRANRKGE